MDAPAPGHDLYHIASATPCSVADWCEALARQYSGFRHGIADTAASASINLHGDRDRRSLSGDRLAVDIGHTLPDVPAVAFTDFLDWMARHGAFWADKES